MNDSLKYKCIKTFHKFSLYLNQGDYINVEGFVLLVNKGSYAMANTKNGYRSQIPIEVFNKHFVLSENG